MIQEKLTALFKRRRSPRAILVLLIPLLVAVNLVACGRDRTTPPAADATPDGNVDTVAEPAATSTNSLQQLSTDPTQAAATTESNSLPAPADPSALPPPDVYPMTLPHDLGEITLDAQPQRIAVLGPTLLDLLLSLNVQPVGYAESGLFVVDAPGSMIEPDQIALLGPYLTEPIVNLSTRQSPSLEAVEAAAPDLILADMEAHRQLYPELSAIAPTLVFSSGGQDEWKRTLPILARALGKDAGANVILERHEQRMEAARRRLAPIIDGQRWLLLISDDYTRNSEITVLAGSTLLVGVLTDIGFGIVIGEADQTAQIEPEMLNQIAIDGVIALADQETTVEDTAEAWATTPALTTFQASHNRGVIILTAKYNRVHGPLSTEMLLRELEEQLDP